MTHEYSERFEAKNYGLMHHTDTVQGTSKSVLALESILICRENIVLMTARIPGNTISLFHSEALCTRLTAETVGLEFTRLGFRILETTPLPWLNRDRWQVTNANVRIVAPKSDTSFSLFITHEPDMMMFLGEENGICNNTIVARDFTITGRREESGVF